MLCKAFDISISKSYFPFNLTNINYTGVFPQLEYWSGVSPSLYDSIKAEFGMRMWSFKDEAIKYCKLDCKTLHKILVKFNELIFSHFKININKSLTLPSLAMKIYKNHFMPKDSIYQILGDVEKAIRQSYSGGAVDVYIPHNRISAFLGNIKSSFKQLFYYDVNSLYPTVMAKHLMPIGKPTIFEGNIRLVEPDAYGFFYCKITSPDKLEHPILQRRIKTSDGLRTIAGLGTWNGWISSLEVDNAIKYGYQFEILKGYQFEQGDLFSGYVNRMYELRSLYPKTHAMNLIAKLLMNSLYGKFGMKMDRTEVSIYDYSTDKGRLHFKDMLDNLGETVQDYIQIDNHYLIVRNTLLSLKYNEKEDMYHGQDINIAIASAITGGARVHMSVFKNNSNFNLYYSDTDSIVIDQPINPDFIRNRLGQLKLEHLIKKAVFIAPKVYGLVDVDGTEVIKIKGITKKVAADINFEDLEFLLIQDTKRTFTQEKWFKNLIEGEISISDVLYNLKVTTNKRRAVYVDNIFNSTEPLYYDDIIK